MQTEEIFSIEEAKNLNPSTKIKCSNCQEETELTLCVKERPLPKPFHLVVEGVIICPVCGLESHTYYMSEFLRYKQNTLAKATENWHKYETTPFFHKMRNAKISYIKQYEIDQEKYAAFMENQKIKDAS